MSFTKQSILAIVIAIVASDQAQADWQSWISGQSLKNLGNSVASELVRVFYKAPKCLYENTSKSEKVVGACALFGTVGTGYYFYKKYQNAYEKHQDACNILRNCITKYDELDSTYNTVLTIYHTNHNKLKRRYNRLLTSPQSCGVPYSKLSCGVYYSKLSCGVHYSKLITTDFIARYNKNADNLKKRIATKNTSRRQRYGIPTEQQKCPKSSPVQSGNTVPLHNQTIMGRLNSVIGLLDSVHQI